MTVHVDNWPILTPCNLELSYCFGFWSKSICSLWGWIWREFLHSLSSWILQISNRFWYLLYVWTRKNYNNNSIRFSRRLRWVLFIIYHDSPIHQNYLPCKWYVVNCQYGQLFLQPFEKKWNFFGNTKSAWQK